MDTPTCLNCSSLAEENANLEKQVELFKAENARLKDQLTLAALLANQGQGYRKALEAIKDACEEIAREALGVKDE